MERKKLRFEILIEKLFTNFGKLFLTNLLFAVPSLAFFFAFYFLRNALFPNTNIVFCLLSIIFIYPFYAGVVKVIRNIVRGDETFSVFQTFISGIKENFLPFLLHGFVISIASIISFLSINLYINLVSQSWIFGALLFFSIIVVLFILFASFYLPLMTVTFELPLRYVYKNSFLMSYGEIKNNFFALFAVIVFFGIVLTFMLIAGNALWALIIVIALWALLLLSSRLLFRSSFMTECSAWCRVRADWIRRRIRLKRRQSMKSRRSKRRIFRRSISRSSRIRMTISFLTVRWSSRARF